MGFKKTTLPTMRQIGYLSELEKLDSDSGQIMQVARRCQTDHSAVSRFFKNCCDIGILTEDYRLTEYGENWLHGTKHLIAELRESLRKAGFSEEEQESTCRAMIENIEPHLLKMMLSGKSGTDASRSSKSVRVALFEALSERERFRVAYCFYRTEGEYTRARFSMANGGFERDAYLCWIRGNAYLELTTCEMTAHSRVDGREMTGCLRTLKYNDGGILRTAKIKDGHVLLPLNACRLWQGQNDVIRGVIFVTATCSVGNEHMPESTAALVFWV